MKCITINDQGNRSSVSLLKPKYNDVDIQLSVIDTGVVSISLIEDSLLKNALILHTTNTENNGIDVETKLISRTNLTENDIKLINVEELVEAVIPKNSTNFSNQILSTDFGFINYVKTCNTTNTLKFKTALKYEDILYPELRTQLMNFVQHVSKIAFFIERNQLGITKLSEYLLKLSQLTKTNLDEFSSSQFQQITSVVKHCDVDVFNSYYDDYELSNNPLITKIIKNIDLIKATTNQRLNFNFKGLKIYLTSKSMSFNLLGSSFNNPTSNHLNICLSHLLMCNQIHDFDDKLERIKLLHA